MTVEFEIVGCPRSKGNSPTVIQWGKRLIPLPSKPYRKWFKDAMAQAPIVYLACSRAGILLPIRQRVVVSARWFFDTRRFADADNMCKGLGDFLQRAGVVWNDRLIDWSLCYRDVDRAHPRTMVILTVKESTP